MEPRRAAYKQQRQGSDSKIPGQARRTASADHQDSRKSINISQKITAPIVPETDSELLDPQPPQVADNQKPNNQATDKVQQYLASLEQKVSELQSVLRAKEAENTELREQLSQFHVDTASSMRALEAKIIELEANLAEKEKKSTMAAAAQNGLATVSTGLFSGMTALASGLGDNFTTMSVLKAATQAKLIAASPLSMAKIGRIIRAMKSCEYRFSDDEMDLVVNATYVNPTDDNLKAMFEMFDSRLCVGKPQGFLSAESFKRVLPLLGEDVDLEKMDELFRSVDTDGSGAIEFDEFKTLVLSIPRG